MTLPLSRVSILEALAAARQLVGGHHPRADAAGAVEILAHAPLRGVALIFADRAFHAAGIAGDAIGCVLKRQMLCPPADDDDHFAFIVELDRFARPHQRLHMRRQRRQHAEKDRLEFRDVVALRAFLDVIEVIKPETDDLAGPRDRKRKLQPRKRAARRGRRFLCQIGERLQVAIAAAQHLAKIGGRVRIDRLQIDDAIALDHAEPRAPLASKPTIFMKIPRSAAIPRART